MFCMGRVRASFPPVTFTMLDVPSHLLQPLCINTNITYDLDTTMFPGLDDPQQMYQPALLIATDWSDYVYHDAQGVTHDADCFPSSDESGNSLDSDLYSLIDSTDAFFTDQNLSVDDITLQTLLDDVTADSAIPDDIFGLVDIDADTPSDLPTSDSPQAESPNTGLTCAIDTEDVQPVRICGRGQKRRLCDDLCFPHTDKRSKMEPFTQVLTCLVNISHGSKNGGMYRDS